ncbi:MAG: hypothetical protein K9J42_13405 [Sulfuritalea sp.]|nr:hypothetical protein [Sulfuritalea sp.]
MKSTTKPIAKRAATSSVKGASSKRVVRSSVTGQFVSKDMTAPQLRRAMVSYSKEIAGSRKTAVAFLNRIGAPVKATKR